MSVFQGCEGVAPQSAPAPDYENLTKAELVAIANERGLSVSSRASKAQIVKALTEQGD